MSLTLELPKELEYELKAEAGQFGLSLAEYSLRLLLSRSLPKSTLQSGAELVAYWQDAEVIGSRTDIADSQVHARLLRERAEQRQQQEN